MFLAACPGMDLSQLPWKIGFVVCGPEAIVAAKKKAWNAEELFFEKLGGADEVTKMVEADSYDFVCADGYAEEIAKEDLANVEIFFTEDKSRVDATSIMYPEYTLQDILYIVPHGVDAENLPADVAENTVYKITIFNTAVKETEADSALLYVPEDATQEAGRPFTEILEGLGLSDAAAINVICADGYSEEIDAADIPDAYIFHNGESIDATSIMYPEYTLQNAAKIEIVK